MKNEKKKVKVKEGLQRFAKTSVIPKTVELLAQKDELEFNTLKLQKIIKATP